MSNKCSKNSSRPLTRTSVRYIIEVQKGGKNMKTKMSLKLILGVYLVIAFVTMISMNRFEKLESQEDVMKQNETALLHVN